MALIKSQELDDGSTAEYWCIDGIESFSWEKRHASFFFDLYVSKARADAGKKPTLRRALRMMVDGDVFDAYFSKAVLAAVDEDIAAQAYKAAKAGLSLDAEWGSGALLKDAVDA